MSSRVEIVAPDRLQITEGGVFLSLTVLGVVPVGNASELHTLGWFLMTLLGIAFTLVGGVLVFGRSWITLDRTQRQVIKQWGLLIPLRARIFSLDGYTTVTVRFVEGDSDSADRYPVALKAQAGPDLPLCSFTVYAQARDCTRVVSEHLHLEMEEASTDHPIRLRASQADTPLRQRLRQEASSQARA